MEPFRIPGFPRFWTADAILGVGGLLGALLAARAGALLGQGRTVLVARVLMAVAWLVVAVAPELAGWSIVVVSAGQFLYGYSIGVEDPNEMAYRQAVTPGALLGRARQIIRRMYARSGPRAMTRAVPDP